MTPPFTFPAWYARMGYHYRGGVRDCARDLGVTREHVRLLRRGEREPGGTLVKLCEVLEALNVFPRSPAEIADDLRSWGAVAKDQNPRWRIDEELNEIADLIEFIGFAVSLRPKVSTTEFPIVELDIETITDPDSGEEHTRATDYVLTKPR